ncbi:hypothetical protein ACRAWF_40980 [Streptomyces sp. L7]
MTDEGTSRGGAVRLLQLPAERRGLRRQEDRVGQEPSPRRPLRSGPPPAVTTRWSPPGTGLAIAALAETGAYFDRPDLVEAAVSAADSPRTAASRRARQAGPHQQGRPESARTAGVLEDYADVAEGFLALASVTGRGCGWSSPGSPAGPCARRVRGRVGGALRHRFRR